jgi:hypothetical protein
MQIEDLFLVAGQSDQSLQTLINRIASCGLWGLIIPADYTGTDSFTNPSNVAVIDLRTNGTGLLKTITGSLTYIVTSQDISNFFTTLSITFSNPIVGNHALLFSVQVGSGLNLENSYYIDAYSITSPTVVIVGVGIAENAQAGDTITVQGIALII